MLGISLEILMKRPSKNLVHPPDYEYNIDTESKGHVFVSY
jgi:hypothetical protein